MYFEVAAFKDQVTIQWRLSSELPETHRFHKDKVDFDWNSIYIQVEDNRLEAGWKGWEMEPEPQPAISTPIDNNAYMHLFSGKFLIYLGGMPQIESNSISKGFYFIEKPRKQF